MFKQYFANLESTGLPLFALWLFIGVFVIVVLRTFVVKRATEFDADAQLPLNDGTQLSPHEVKP